MLISFSQSVSPSIVLIYMDDNIKSRTDLSNDSYSEPQKSLPKTLKMQPDQNKNNSKHSTAMLNPRRSKFAESHGPQNIFHKVWICL